MIETEDIRLSQERLAALKELLTPIKDLAKSWNVDISTELENYISQFDDDLNSDNFAEAALVIQGSAAVWSKKVEYLFKFAVDSRTILDENTRKKDKDVSGKDEEKEDVDEMMIFDSYKGKIASNAFFDLSSMNKSQYYKPDLPLCLSSASIRNDDPENMLYNKKGELLASIDDFVMNKCIIDKRGFASIEIESYHLLKTVSKKSALTPFFRRRVSQYDGCANPSKSPFVVESNAAAAAAYDEMHEVGDIPETDEPFDDGQDDPGGALDLSDGSDAEDGVVHSIAPIGDTNEPKTPMHSLHLRSSSKINVTSVTPLVTKSDPVSKEILTLNPYDELPSKPFKKANIEKPKINRKRRKESSPKTSLSDMLQSSNKSAKPVKFHNILRKPVYPENIELFKKLKSKEYVSTKLAKKKIASQPQPISLPDDLFKPPEVAETSDHDDFDPGIEDDFDNDFCGTVSENLQPEGLKSSEDPEISHNLEDLENRQEKALSDQNPQSTISYEDIVRQHVLKFSLGAGNRYQASELRTRVIDWENKITPVLEEEEKAPPFNVCYYSNKLISKLSECDNEQATFKNLVEGESKGEVCRLFLTSLMLTNSANIQLSGDNDDTKCKLISRTLFSDVLEGYVAAESASSVPSASNRKRKNVPK